MKTYAIKYLSLLIAVVMLLGVMALPVAASSSEADDAAVLTPEQQDFVRRINLGFEAIVAGNYEDACKVFGFTGGQSIASFTHGMHFVEESSLTILRAVVDETSVRDGVTAMSARVTLYVQQDDTELTFGYMQQWPRGVYSMDFYVMKHGGMIFIPEHVLIYGDRTPGLLAIRLPGQAEDSLTIVTNTCEDRPFVFDSPVSFMSELWLILQSFNLASMYAIFWGFAPAA